MISSIAESQTNDTIALRYYNETKLNSPKEWFEKIIQENNLNEKSNYFEISNIDVSFLRLRLIIDTNYRHKKIQELSPKISQLIDTLYSFNKEYSYFIYVHCSPSCANFQGKYSYSYTPLYGALFKRLMLLKHPQFNDRSISVIGCDSKYWSEITKKIKLAKNADSVIQFFIVHKDNH